MALPPRKPLMRTGTIGLVLVLVVAVLILGYLFFRKP